MAGRFPGQCRGVHEREFTVLVSLFIVRYAPAEGGWGLPFDQDGDAHRENLKLL